MDNYTTEQAAIQGFTDVQQVTPVMPIYPVLPMPFDPFCPQFSPQEALEKGTLFKWLYDPYVPTMPRRRGLFG
ncbi:hypothetical protein BHU72_15040 [Desulfuribacillus stibiiarsenatis]|uniref:Spore coat protein CotJA n=1 Tax=Desulfuribacillus stibiiarsenatis TaxID=1390249 RepID=A0A1E5L617_9FIRM|nr:spore coat associated protein CotJA [Desulfuribacillus stibiiarsenatis]OEH85556.1 hypothetical protein BHU72_15040 [Desulfuribacillus stibiiarsenatis]